MAVSASVMFRSEQFDYQSNLPADFNAGNKFYGRDVAEFLSTNLTGQGLNSDYLDEDWGWLVFSAKGATLEFGVAIYNLAEHGEGGRPGIGVWGLWVRTYERKKLLGLFPKRSEVAVPMHFLEAVRAAVRAAGADPEPWKDGPSA